MSSINAIPSDGGANVQPGMLHKCWCLLQFEPFFFSPLVLQNIHLVTLIPTDCLARLWWFSHSVLLCMFVWLLISLNMVRNVVCSCTCWDSLNMSWPIKKRLTFCFRGVCISSDCCFLCTYTHSTQPRAIDWEPGCTFVHWVSLCWSLKVTVASIMSFTTGGVKTMLQAHPWKKLLLLMLTTSLSMAWMNRKSCHMMDWRCLSMNQDCEC